MVCKIQNKLLKSAFNFILAIRRNNEEMKARKHHKFQKHHIKVAIGETYMYIYIQEQNRLSV